MTWHANATSIHKGAYIQSSDPGAVGAKVLWIDTTSGFVLKKRNDADSGWDTVADLGGIASSGDVDGPASSTDNAITRFDGTTGKLVQNSVVVISDAGAITVPEIAAPSTPASGTVHIYAKSDGKLYIKDDAGTETDLTGGGGGATNPTTLFVPYNNAGTFDDSRIKREATDITALNGGVNTIQTFKVYASDDGSGNTRFVQISNTGSVFEILSTSAGTGGTHNLHFGVAGAATRLLLGTSGLQPTSDRGYNLGASGSQWNQVWGFQFLVDGGGDISFAAGNMAKIASVSNGKLRIRDSANNTGSGTIEFEERAPAQITANQNNYDPVAPAYFLRLSSDASRDITGLTFTIGGKASGQVHLLVNVGSNDIVLKHEDANSTAANRFLNSTGADITLAANQAADIIYDNATQRWRVFKRN